MSLDNLFEGLQPRAGARVVNTGLGTIWENVNQVATPSQSSTETPQGYLESIFAGAKPDWRQAPPTIQPHDEGFLESAGGLLKDIGGAITQAPQALYDWGEGFFTNKQTQKGITNLSEFERRLGSASTDTERQQAQQQMLQEGIITTDYFNQKKSTQTDSEIERQKYFINATSGVKDELTEAVKPFLNTADKMQQKYILAAIDRQVNQYGKAWSSINDSYDGSEFNKRDYFNKLNTDIVAGIKDTVVNFSKKIMEGKDSQQAYDELVPTMKDTFSNIAQFGLDVADKSNLASREHFYGKAGFTDPLATIGLLSTYVQEATQEYLTKPLEYGKQKLLSDYDVVEDLQKMGVYSDTASVWQKAGATFSKVGGDIISGIPQIAPVIGVVAAELAIGNIPALAMLTKGSKIRTGVGELAKDTLLYNGMVQASLGRGMTEKDMAENFMFDGPIDASLGLLEKPLKAQLDKTWLDKFGKDYGFEPSNTVSQGVLDLLNKGNKDAAMTLHLADVSSGKMGDVTISSLSRQLQGELGSMQTVLKQTVDNVANNTNTYKEGVLVDSAAKAVLENKTPADIVEHTNITNKIANHINTELANPDSILSNKQSFTSLSTMIKNNAIKPDEISSTLDVVGKSLSGTRIGGVKVSEESLSNTVDFMKSLFTKDGSYPKTAIDSPEKLQLFNIIQNELYKSIAVSRSTVPGTQLGRFVVREGENYFDKITGELLDKGTFITTLDAISKDKINRSQLETVYNQLIQSTGGVNYLQVLGLSDIMNQHPQLVDFIKGLGVKGIVAKEGQRGIYPAVMAGRIKNILDGNLNLTQLTTNDLALIRMLMIPGIVAKGKTLPAEIIKDNAWNLWDKSGMINTKFANPAKVNQLMKNVLKDGDVSDMVSVAGDIVGIDKNINHINKSTSFPSALSKSVDTIKNTELRKSVQSSLSSDVLKETDNIVDQARVLHEVVDAIAEDKVLAEAVDTTETIIKQELSDGIVNGMVNKKAGKIKIINRKPLAVDMKKNVGGMVIGGRVIEPVEIKTYEDQIKVIEDTLLLNNIDDKAFIAKVTDSIGLMGVLSFEKVNELTQDAIGKLIGWSRSDIKLKTGTIADIKNGIHIDIKNFIDEVDTIKQSVADSVDMYRQILRKKYEYSTKLYGHILAGEYGKYINDLYQLLQTSRDVRFLSSNVKIDKFIDNIRSELLSVDIKDIRNLTYKSFDEITTKENRYRMGDKVWSVKRGAGQYFIKNGKAPALIRTTDVVIKDKEITYIVLNDIGVGKIANPVKVSGLSDGYKFITTKDLITGNFEPGNPIYLSQRLSNTIMKNDGDKLIVSMKDDIQQIIKNIINNPDVKTIDMDVYAYEKNIVIQPADINKANNLFKIKTMESDIVYQNAIKTFVNGFSTDTISGFSGKYADILNENKRMLEHIYTNLGPDNKLRTDDLIEKFFKQYDITQKSLINVNNVNDIMFNELYKYGNLYRTIMRDSIKDIKKDAFVKLENIATSYQLHKEYNDFLYSLPSNPDVYIQGTAVHDMFIEILKDNNDDVSESLASLYSVMIRNDIPLKDIKEGMTSILQVYGFDNKLPEYIHEILYPTVDIFRGQQVVDAVMSAVGGKNKQSFIDEFNSNIISHLKTFNVTHFGTDMHLIKFLEGLQKQGYINSDINIYKAATTLGENGDKLKTMLRQVYNSDIIRLIDDIEGDDVLNNVYQGIASNISEVIDRINLGEKFKSITEKVDDVDVLQKAEAEELIDTTEFISGAISMRREIDVSGLLLNFKQSIDELINQEAELLMIKGEYGTLAKRDIVWSDIATHKITGFASNKQLEIIEKLKNVKGKAQTNENLAFTHPIRGGTSTRKVSDNIYNALTYNTSENIKADAYNIISKSDFDSEHEFIKQIKPTFYMPTGDEIKLTGESNLETAQFINKVIDQIQFIQHQLLSAKNKEELKNIGHGLFDMVTESGFKLTINTDGLKDFPIWKGYLNRLYKANPDFFGEPLNEMFLFKQLEQLNKFVNNVLVDIGKKTGRADLFTVKNPRLDVYRNLKNSIQNVLDNYSNQLGIGRTGFEQTMFEKKAYAGILENELRKKGGLGTILSKDGQNLLKNISKIEVIGYTPVVKYIEDGVIIAEEKLERIIPVEDIEDYIQTLSGAFINKSELDPRDFGINNIDYNLRLTSKDGKIYDVKIGENIEEITEVKLIGDTYSPNKEPAQDINRMMDTNTATEYKEALDTFTC